MRITVLKEAAPGEQPTICSQSGEWFAIWCGKEPAEMGGEYEVELEIDVIDCWDCGAFDQGHRSGVFTSDGKVTVCGRVSMTFDDGVFVVDLAPGNVMIEQDDLSPAVKEGQHVCFEPNSVQLYPVDY